MFGSSNFSVKKLSALGAVLSIILMSCGGSSTSSNAGKSKNRTLDAPCYADQAAKDAAKEAAVEVSPVTTIVTPAKEAYFADDKGNVYTGASTESLGTNDFQDTDGTWIRYNAATEAVTEVVTKGKSLETAKAEIDNALICAPSDANAAGNNSSSSSSSNTVSSIQIATPVLSVALDQDEVLFLATVTSASTEDIVVSGCGLNGGGSNQTAGLRTSFEAARQTADCTVTVTQGSLTASSEFKYSSQVLTQGGDNNITDLNKNDLDFTLGTPVYDGAGKWTIDTQNMVVMKEQGYGFSITMSVQCLILDIGINFQLIVEAPNGCMAGMATLTVIAQKPTSEVGVAHTAIISETPTKKASDCVTPPLVSQAVVSKSCLDATALVVQIAGTNTFQTIFANSVKIDPSISYIIWHLCGNNECGPNLVYRPATPAGDLDITCSEPSYEVSNDDASLLISAGKCSGNDAALVTEMNIEVTQPCSSSNLLISCIIEGVERSTLVLQMGTSERVQLQAGNIRLTAKYFGIQDDGEVIFVSDPFQHEIDFQRRCDPIITPDSLAYAKNVGGNPFFTFFTSCKNVNGSNLYVFVREEDGTKWRLTNLWTYMNDGTQISATDMGGRLTGDQAGKTYLVEYFWEGSNILRTFEFTLPINWRKAKAADPLPTFETRSDDAGNVFGKLGELSDACANYQYNFRIESIDRADDFRDGPIFDVTTESKWASNLPNGVYRVWFYSEESLNDGTPCNAMDQEITVKQAEKPAEPPVIVVVDPIITLPRIDNTNKNDAVIVESQVTSINCALNCYDDLISLTGQTEGELYVQVVGSDGETAWMQVDRTKSINQIPINGQTQKLNVRVFDKKTNTYSDGSINLNRIQSANATNVANGDTSSNNSTRNIIIILIVVLICGYLVKTLVLDKRKTV